MNDLEKIGITLFKGIIKDTKVDLYAFNLRPEYFGDQRTIKKLTIELVDIVGYTLDYNKPESEKKGYFSEEIVFGINIPDELRIRVETDLKFNRVGGIYHPNVDMI